MQNDDTRYNGWANYQTWLVSLWLSNDVCTYQSIREVVEGANDAYGVSEAIKTFVEDLNPVGDQASLFADLMSASLRQVDWVQVAESFLEE